LYTIVCVALIVGSLGAAVVAAHKLGGSDSHIVWVLAATIFLHFSGAFPFPTQCFAYPLFVGVLWLLTAAVRHPSQKRVYFVFPLLLLWANAHGSVIIGVALAALYGLVLLAEDFRAGRRWRVRLRGIVFVLATPLCLLATPYGIHGLSYYYATIMNPAFKTFITEWEPITSVLTLAVPFFVCAFAIVWIFGLARGRTCLFEALAMLALTVASIWAVRNIVWFALAALILVPQMLGTVVPSHPSTSHRRFDFALLGVGTILLLTSLAVVATEYNSWFEQRFDTRALQQVRDTLRRQPDTLVFANGNFPDWLLWHDPDLAGHVAYDSRSEVLTSAQMLQLMTLTEIRPAGIPDPLSKYGLLVLDTARASPELFIDPPRVHVVLRGRGVVVATRSGG
jgi:hypothetical protein